jgi:hypothetical protein
MESILWSLSLVRIRPNRWLKTHSFVAVHGLGGHYERTWTHENGHNWLRDSLPLQIPGARVFAYGYDSTIAFSKSIATIEDFGKDLLVRVASERKTVEVTQARFIPIQDHQTNQMTDA